MNAIVALLAPFWRPIAAGFAALAGSALIYLKGRSDAAQKAETGDLRNANAIRKAGADARDSARADGLRDDDGFRRRDP